MKAGRRTAVLTLAAVSLLPRLVGAAPKKRLAFMHFEPVSDWKDWTDPVVAALSQQGIVARREVDILYEGIMPGTGGGPEPVAARAAKRIPEIRPDVIVTEGPIFTLILKLATNTVPIVTHTADPVGAGFAQSLAKPGGNITGLADGVEETSAKTMELVKRLVPHATRIAIFSDPRPAASRFAANFERAARSVGIEPVMIVSKEQEDHMSALRGLPERKIPAGLLAWAQSHPRKMAQAAIASRIPLFAPDYDWARFGFLGGYSAYDPNPHPKLAAIAAQILRGAKPGEIPFELPRQYRLELNRRTAEAMGVTLPADLLLRADRVIE